MASIVSAFDEIDGPPPSDRDDLAIRAVANQLPRIFSGNICNPALPHLNLDQNWSAEDRAEFIARATDLKNTIELTTAHVLCGVYFTKQPTILMNMSLKKNMTEPNRI